MKTLTPHAFDKLITRPTAGRSNLASESLWGAATIAKFMGVSDDYVRTLAKRNDTPIRMKAGRYFCTRTEIVVWLNSDDRK